MSFCTNNIVDVQGNCWQGQDSGIVFSSTNFIYNKKTVSV